MKVLIAPQAFKGSLSAQEAAEAIAKGVLRAFPETSTVLLPVADGGDDTLDVLLRATKGQKRTFEAQDALGTRRQTYWGLIPNNFTAVIEIAQVCGIASLSREKRNPLHTTTFGVGEVIIAALDEGIRNFLIGIGGSATNDAGIGMAKALGVRFLDHHGIELPTGGGELHSLQKIDITKIDPRVRESRFIVAADVSNPLLGPRGASRIYAPQKGATPEMVEILEGGMRHFAKVVWNQFKIDCSQIDGAGAAGGLGVGMYLFLGAKIKHGSEVILDLLNFDEFMTDIDLVITGEGRMDVQTHFHKAPFEVARRARAKGIPVIGVVGQLGEGHEVLYQEGFEGLFASSQGGVPAHPGKALTLATEQALRTR